jgi:hypothetical protein
MTLEPNQVLHLSGGARRLCHSYRALRPAGR